MEPIIRIENLHHTYATDSREPVHALRGVDLTIHKGEYVTILGHNGSGKSTLAKHLNALLLPTAGDVWVKEWNTREQSRLLDIRSTVGMVFQTPDNQIVATIVEEDIAFGPENLGVPYTEIVRRVDWSLEQVRMQPYRHRAPHLLSGGQKQRICIAGVLAMEPQVLVLDEATAMLDPLGRREVLELAHRLNREQGVTVVAVTHFMREAVDADRIVVMADGRIALEGPPRAVFRQIDRLRELRLDVPHISALSMALHERHADFPPDLLTVDEIVQEVARRCAGRAAQPTLAAPRPALAEPQLALAAHLPAAPAPAPGEPVIAVRHLVHYYMRGTPLEVRAIHDINIEIGQGEIVGILGHTGSGKSTAVQHFNGLLRPHEGEVFIFGQDLRDPGVDVLAIRRRVGLVFQMPEAQLFERYVGDDIAYGPRKLGVSRAEVRARVRRAMEAVGLGFEEFKDRHTFSLSGGQMRRVALAGVLALEPAVLVLDEPTAGLDPQARRQLMAYFLGLHEQGITLVIISHNMEELAEVGHRLVVIADGRTVLSGSPTEVFGRADELRSLGLDVPDVTLVADELVQAGLLAQGATVTTLDQAIRTVGALLANSQDHSGLDQAV